MLAQLSTRLSLLTNEPEALWEQTWKENIILHFIFVFWRILKRRYNDLIHHTSVYARKSMSSTLYSKMGSFSLYSIFAAVVTSLVYDKCNNEKRTRDVFSEGLFEWSSKTSKKGRKDLPHSLRHADTSTNWPVETFREPLSNTVHTVKVLCILYC